MSSSVVSSSITASPPPHSSSALDFTDADESLVLAQRVFTSIVRITSDPPHDAITPEKLIAFLSAQLDYQCSPSFARDIISSMDFSYSGDVQFNEFLPFFEKFKKSEREKRERENGGVDEKGGDSQTAEEVMEGHFQHFEKVGISREELKDVFYVADQNGDGELDLHELKNFMEAHCGQTFEMSEIATMTMMIDPKNPKGNVSYNALVKFILAQQ